MTIAFAKDGIQSILFEKYLFRQTAEKQTVFVVSKTFYNHQDQRRVENMEYINILIISVVV